MAIERMEMLNLVGHKDDMDRVLRDLVILGCVQPVREVQEAHIADTLEFFSIGEEYAAPWVRVVTSKWEFREAQMRLELLMQRLGISHEVDRSSFSTDYDFKDVESNINVMFERFSGLLKRIEGLEKEKKELERVRVLSILKDVHLDLRELQQMAHYSYRIGTISKEHRTKLSMNYENISAGVMHLGDWNDQEIYMIAFPRILEAENLRILRSIDFEEYTIPKEYLDVPASALARLEIRLAAIDEEIREITLEMDRFRHTFEGTIKDCYYKMRMEETLVEIRSHVTVTRNFFFISAWVARCDLQAVQNVLGRHGDRLIHSIKADSDVDTSHVRPTRLRNAWLVRPFELLVKTYGTPSYDELDPTFFVGITYMLLFGAMFGDLGQGFVIFLAGLFISKKIHPMGGGILSRVGVGSMAFGIFYNDFFGSDRVIIRVTRGLLGERGAERFHFHTMESIDQVLLASVIAGIGLLVISFGIGIFNKLKRGDVIDGLIGKNGMAGLTLYVLLLLMVSGVALGNAIVPLGIGAAAAVFLTVIIALKHPLENLFHDHRPIFHEGLGAFGVEAFFETFEIYLGYFSNTLSFVRVGAFALNHVGMFQVFLILADMIGGIGGQISMYILGNIIIIGLEGLIVMIQGMRLVYYEIFSKYYDGDGIDFKAITLEA